MKDFVKLENVRKIYQMGEVEIRAVDGIDFEIGKGEFVVIVGPSGAGKTTVLNILGGMDTATSGKVLVDGNDVAQYTNRQLIGYRREDIGFVFQFYNLVPNLTALENVELALQICKEPLDAKTVLEEVGLGERLNNFPAQLSGGEQQRVSIARALAKNPKLLLCDEPIASLDPSSAKTIMELLHDMTQKRNIACIVNLHQLDVALKYSTRIIGLSKGEVVFDGTPGQLTDEMIEKIYGTSRANLMIGGEEHDQTDTVNCA